MCYKFYLDFDTTWKIINCSTMQSKMQRTRANPTKEKRYGRFHGKYGSKVKSCAHIHEEAHDSNLSNTCPSATKRTVRPPWLEDFSSALSVFNTCLPPSQTPPSASKGQTGANRSWRAPQLIWRAGSMALSWTPSTTMCPMLATGWS